MNRDYTVKSTDEGGFSAMLFLLFSVGRACSDQEAMFFADCLEATNSYYLQNSPNAMASEVGATVAGIAGAVSKAAQRFGDALGIEVPKF